MPDPQPYVGPRPFGPEDAVRFFGREREKREILSLIVSHPVTLIYSQSGAGKTSLLNAGVIPLLRERGAEVLGPCRVGGALPPGISASDVPNIFVFNAILSLERNPERALSFRADTLARYLSQPHPGGGAAVPQPRVLVLDQFEELFTSHIDQWPKRADFIEDLADALEQDSRLRVVFVMREEYIAHLDAHASLLPERLRTRTRIERLRRENALQAVTRPVAPLAYSYAPGTAERLVDSLLQLPAGPGAPENAVAEFVEPVQLQVVCKRLWNSLPDGVRVIDDRFIDDYGNVNQALSSYYEECLAAVARQSDVREGRLRRWFEDALITSSGTRGTAYRGTDLTAGLPNDTVQLLQNFHLVRVEMRGGAPWCELSHDRFIGPILESNQRWRNEQTSRKLSTDLEVRASEWERKGHSADLLLTGSELVQATEWLATPEAYELGTSERVHALLRASELAVQRQRAESESLRAELEAQRAAAALEQANAEAARAQSAAERSRLLTRQRRGLVFAGVLLSMLAALALVSSNNERKQRKREAAAMLIQRGEVASDLAAHGRPFDALVYGLQAVAPIRKGDFEPQKEARLGLQDAVAALGGSVWLRGFDPEDEVTISRDGKLALGWTPRAIAVWETATGKLLRQVNAHPDSAWGFSEFSPHGSIVFAWVRAAKDQARDIELPGTHHAYSSRTGERLRTLERLIREKQFRLSSDDAHVVVAVAGRRVEIFETGTGRSIARMPASVREISELEISTDQTAVAAVTPGRIHIWNRRDGRITQDTINTTGVVSTNAQFSNDGRLVLLVRRTLLGDMESIYDQVVWDTRSGARLFTSRSRTPGFQYVVFSPDGQKIHRVTSDLGQGVSIETVALSNPERQTVVKLPGDELTRFSQFTDQHVLRLVSNEDSSTLQAWRIDDGRLFLSMPLPREISSINASQDLNTVVTIMNDDVRVWTRGRPAPQVDQISVDSLYRLGCKSLEYQPEYDRVRSLCNPASLRQKP